MSLPVTTASLLTLCDGIDAENLLADKGYDSDAFIGALEKNGVNPVIPPRKGRKAPRDYDRYLYRFRHLVENAFPELKRWRGIATRYARTPHHSWLLYISDVSLSGQKLIDDTV